MTSALATAGTAATTAGKFLATPGGQALGKAAGQVGSAALAARSAGKAARQLQAGAQAGRADIQTSIAQARGDIGATLQPTLEALGTGAEAAESRLFSISRPGISAFQEQAALSGALGQEAQAGAFGRFQESPEQAFIRQQGEQAITRQAAATGGLGGARVLEALQQRGIGLAAQDIGQRFERLGAIARPGIQAQTNLSNILQQLAVNRAGAIQATGTGLANIAVGGGAPLAQLSQAQAQAGAAGTLGRGAALQAGLGGIARGVGEFAGFNQPATTAVGGQTISARQALGDFARVSQRTVQGAKLGSLLGPAGTLIGGAGGAAVGLFERGIIGGGGGGGGVGRGAGGGGPGFGGSGLGGR